MFKKNKNRGSKGIAIETVGYLLLAVVALILLWVFLNKSTPHIITAVNNIVSGMMCYLCKMMNWAKHIMPFCWGC